MKRNLSILIPVYNYNCVSLVEGLCQQAKVLGINYEIIVAEDGSYDEECLKFNSSIAKKENCRYLVRDKNVGRARIRNILAQESRNEWLLFLDCDMQLPHNSFLSEYMNSDAYEVIDGGFAVKENRSMYNVNLRYTYEWNAQTNHNAYHRRKNPYHSFRTTNFMVRRDIMINHPFDERFILYGYEDVLFGKQLKIAGIGICHIDNPMILTDLESNTVFVEKTEEALRSLSFFGDDLRGYSRLLAYKDGIKNCCVKTAIRIWHRLFGQIERKWLCSNHPNLTVFNLYKLGFFMSLDDCIDFPQCSAS